MKKNSIVYSASDFANATAAVVIENCWWAIDSIDFTNVGEYSKAPLFELQLKRIVGKDASAPEGYEDASMELEPNRTYYVREGRPMYNALAELWEATDGDGDAVRNYVNVQYATKSYRGRVERLSGVSYTSQTKRGTTIQRSRFEVWYPQSYDEGRILEDFVYLCNKGVYTPIVEEKKEDDLVDLSKVDPKLIATIKAMMKK